MNEEIFQKAIEGLEELLEEQNEETTLQWFENLTSPDRKDSLVSEAGLEFRRESEIHGTLWEEGRQYFRIDGELTRGTVRITSRSGKSIRVRPEEIRKAREFITAERAKLDRVTAAEKQIQRDLEQFLEDETTISILEPRDLQPTRIISDNSVLRFGFTDPSGVVVIRASADAKRGEYSINGKTFKNTEQFIDSLTQELKDYDPAQELRRMRKELRRRLDRLLEDEGFQDYIEDRSLTISKTENDKVYLENAAGKAAAVFAVYPEQGKIVIEGQNGKNTWTLYRSKPSIKDKEKTRFLLIGKNEDLTDTIILVQAGPKMISFLSIPRDIYIHGWKINKLYTSKSPAALFETVQEITGMGVDHYAVVDTDSFADIVDALGTITVELEEEILDPILYYSKDNERRMLYFSAGEHELSGSAALTLARSRSTTSDFSRAGRQQLIITGILKRIEELSLTDAGRVYKLFKTAVEHSETDVGALEAIQYFRQYRNAEQIRHMVLSTDNVFYATYRGLHERGLELKDAAQFSDEELGAWILRPVDEDWSIISRFVEDWFAGKQPVIEDYRSP